MSIFYIAIANSKKKIVCHYPEINNESYVEMTRATVVQKMEFDEGFLNINNLRLHLLNKDGFCFLCIVHPTENLRKCNTFLNQIAENFLRDSGLVERARNCSELQLQFDYGNAMSGYMNSYSSVVSDDKIYNVRKQVEDVRLTMQQNIQLTMERGHNLDRLESSAEKMASEASIFHATTVKVKRKMYCANLRMKFVLAGVVLAIILIVLLIILWQTGAFSGSSSGGGGGGGGGGGNTSPPPP